MHGRWLGVREADIVTDMGGAQNDGVGDVPGLENHVRTIKLVNWR